MTHAHTDDAPGSTLAFEEIEAADAPSFESFWAGMFLGVALVGAVAT